MFCPQDKTYYACAINILHMLAAMLVPHKHHTDYNLSQKNDAYESKCVEDRFTGETIAGLERQVQ